MGILYVLIWTFFTNLFKQSLVENMNFNFGLLLKL